MPYVSSDGRVVESRPWTFKSFTQVFWDVVEFIGLFFKTMFQPNLTSKGGNSQSTYRAGGTSGGPPRGPPPGPRRRMGGFGNGGCGPSAPPMAGGG